MDVFVYGTLTDEARADAVLDEYSYHGAARLDGLHQVDGEYPTLAPGGTADGRILQTDDVGSLDAYENVDGGLYVRVTVPTADGDSVATYVGTPARLGVDSSVEWPGFGPFESRVRTYLDSENIVVHSDE
ncbi:gamma-glutamylcyclotransferase family protein [Halostella sp. PRR32]|uniref:gamma-glutamylcyclotransferase family protein n=1 Tax=Halostella sp. PRR32 TaxID=3098147 RepID=UPI002B1DDE52|nr:gamma-glutamylcyclotransferase family protein [Halostella sp. PRR32]